MKLKTQEILRFGIVGITATATHFLLLGAGVDLLHLPPVPVNAIAFSMAAFITFFGQLLWVFPGHDGLNRARVTKFLASLLAGMAGNTAIMAISTHGLGLPYQVGFLISLVLVPAGSFLLNKLWVFREEAA